MISSVLRILVEHGAFLPAFTWQVVIIAFTPKTRHALRRITEAWLAWNWGHKTVTFVSIAEYRFKCVSVSVGENRSFVSNAKSKKAVPRCKRREERERERETERERRWYRWGKGEEYSWSHWKTSFLRKKIKERKKHVHARRNRKGFGTGKDLPLLESLWSASLECIFLGRLADNYPR